eukprot:TRINITY_DN47782_c0_g1_i1.p1 TRINITY_DN47782_c0_g1~~TRINITY_DN47782_c0_g1_i1.p1  ORF type:complete len:615 (+),score=164.96 TRINITY_DN47782_c0_g1_i1:77-1846(+)
MGAEGDQPSGAGGVAAELAAWLRDVHGTDVSQCPLRVAEVEHGGRGLIARADLQAGEELLRIPFGCFVSEYSALSSTAGPAMRRARAHLSSELRLCLHLIVERALGPRSCRAPYMRSLPDGVGSLDAARDCEVALLQHPVRTGKVQRRRRKVAALYHRLRDAVAREPGLLPDGVPPDAVSAGAFLWAYNMIDSRAFSVNLGCHHPQCQAETGGAAVEGALPDPFETPSPSSSSASEDGSSASGSSGRRRRRARQERGRRPLQGGAPPDDWVLVPFADMFNHAHDGLADYEFELAAPGDAAVGHMVFRAERPYAAGEQVFLRYNQGMGAYQFAKHYGFVPQDTSKRDRFPIPVTLPLARRRDISMLERAKERVFEDFRLARRSEVRMGPEGAEASDSLMAALRLRALHAEDFAKGVQTAVARGARVSISNDLNAYSHLLALLRAALQHYDSTLRQDAELLGRPDLPPGARLCISVRRADKALLASALYVAQQRHRELAAAVYCSDSQVEDPRERAAKRDRESRLREHAQAVSARIGAQRCPEEGVGRGEGDEKWAREAADRLRQLLKAYAGTAGTRYDPAAGAAERPPTP